MTSESALEVVVDLVTLRLHGHGVSKLREALQQLEYALRRLWR